MIRMPVKYKGRKDCIYAAFFDDLAFNVDTVLSTFDRRLLNPRNIGSSIPIWRTAARDSSFRSSRNCSRVIDALACSSAPS